MKTTVDIADGVLADAKLLAERRGLTLRELIEEGLRHVLAQPAQTKPFVLEDGSVKGEGLQPGQREHDWEQVQALMYPEGEDE